VVAEAQSKGYCSLAKGIIYNGHTVFLNNSNERYGLSLLRLVQVEHIEFTANGQGNPIEGFNITLQAVHNVKTITATSPPLRRHAI